MRSTAGLDEGVGAAEAQEEGERVGEAAEEVGGEHGVERAQSHRHRAGVHSQE